MGKMKIRPAEYQRSPSLSVIEDQRQREATNRAIASARKLIGGSIPAAAPVGKLSDIELGWLVSAGICAWIAARSEHATANGFSLKTTEEAIRSTGHEPEPWDQGAVAAILPMLAETPDIDWLLPLNDWPRETMVSFLCAAFGLIRQAMAARDSGDGITRPQVIQSDSVPF